MSKFISTLCIICISATLFSQSPVVIDSMGNVKIGEIFPFNNPLQVFELQENFSGPLINAQVIGSEQTHDIAVYGSSRPADGYGYGGVFKGGLIGVEGSASEQIGNQVEGVRGVASGTGTGFHYGVHGIGLGPGAVWGVQGYAATESSSSSSYGTYGWANGVGTNYAVYGKAENGVTNWAGYFEGNSHFAKKVSIGTTQTDIPLRIVNHQDSSYSSLIHAEAQGVAVNTVAIEGVSTLADGYGTGGVFRGGSVGVKAEVNAVGDDSYIASQSNVSGGTGINYGSLSASSDGIISYGSAGYASGDGFTNYGSYGQAWGGAVCYGSYGNAYGIFSNYGGYGSSSGGTENYGLYGLASGDEGVKYGVYGETYGTGTSWAGYFAGNTQVSGNLGIGTGVNNDLLDRLHILGSTPGIRVANYSDAYGRFALTSNDELHISNSGANPIKFLSNSTERMRINASGNVGIGTTVDTASNRLHISGSDNNGSNAALKVSSGNQYMLMDGNEIDAYGFGMYLNNNSDEDLILVKGGDGRVGINEASPDAMLHIKEYDNNEHGIRIEDDASTSDCSMAMIGNELFFYYGGTAKAKIALVNGAWSPLSDIRVKKNIDYLQDGFLPRVLELQPAAYHYLDNAENDIKSVGFIAQQAHSVFPEFIDQKEDEIMTLDYNLFTVLSVKAIQELSNEKSALAERVAQLENKLIDQQTLLTQQQLLLERIEKLENDR